MERLLKFTHTITRSDGIKLGKIDLTLIYSPIMQHNCQNSENGLSLLIGGTVVGLSAGDTVVSWSTVAGPLSTSSTSSCLASVSRTCSPSTDDSGNNLLSTLGDDIYTVHITRYRLICAIVDRAALLDDRSLTDHATID